MYGVTGQAGLGWLKLVTQIGAVGIKTKGKKQMVSSVQIE
jgi:hypothetical protein